MLPWAHLRSCKARVAPQEFFRKKELNKFIGKVPQYHLILGVIAFLDWSAANPQVRSTRVETLTKNEL